MGAKKIQEYQERKRPKRGRGRLVVAALAVIVLVAVALVFYTDEQPRGPTSNIVFCGVLNYIVFPVVSVTGTKTATTNETITTTTTFTTTTSPAGRVGHVYSNATSTTSANTIISTTETAGVVTICRYITTNSTST
jgi:hypothetical protein